MIFPRRRPGLTRTVITPPTVTSPYVPDMSDPGLLASELHCDGPDSEYARRWARVGGITTSGPRTDV